MTKLVILKRNMWDGRTLYEKSQGTPPMPVEVPDDIKLPKDAVVVKLKKGQTIAEALAEQARKQAAVIDQSNEDMAKSHARPVRDISQLPLDDDGVDGHLSENERQRRRNALKFKRELAAEGNA